MITNKRHIFWLRGIAFLWLFAVPLVSVSAHDYWFEAENFFTRENSAVTLHMELGTRLVIEEERPYQIKKTVFFKLFSADNIWNLIDKSADGATPIARFGVGKSGTYLVGMERSPTDIVLDSQKFNEYLREENLSEVIRERATRGENDKFGYERYRRFIKTLLQVGDKRDDSYRKTLGFQLEIVPLENPYRKRVGDSIKFKILFNNQPLKNKTVFAYNRPQREVFVREIETDEKGECRLKIDRAGFWLVRLVQMERCRTNCDETDWESYWGALSFEIR